MLTTSKTANFFSQSVSLLRTNFYKSFGATTTHADTGWDNNLSSAKMFQITSCSIRITSLSFILRTVGIQLKCWRQRTVLVRSNQYITVIITKLTLLQTDTWYDGTLSGCTNKVLALPCLKSESNYGCKKPKAVSIVYPTARHWHAQQIRTLTERKQNIFTFVMQLKPDHTGILMS